MAYVGGGHRSWIVSITRVVAAHEGCAEFAVLCVHRRNVGVFAWAGLMDRCWTIWTWRAEFGCWAMEVRYQWREWSMRCHSTATGRGYVTMLPRVRFWGQKGGMVRRKTSGTVGGYRQVYMLMVVIRMEGFTCEIKKKKKMNRIVLR